LELSLLLLVLLRLEELEPLELARLELRDFLDEEFESELEPSLPEMSGNRRCRIPPERPRPRPGFALAPPISFGTPQSSLPTWNSCCLFGLLGLGVHVGSSSRRYTESPAQ
jgi:hypothetical protein